jgi:hypothetical protein
MNMCLASSMAQLSTERRFWVFACQIYVWYVVEDGNPCGGVCNTPSPLVACNSCGLGPRDLELEVELWDYSHIGCLGGCGSAYNPGCSN